MGARAILAARLLLPHLGTRSRTTTNQRGIQARAGPTVPESARDGGTDPPLSAGISVRHNRAASWPANGDARPGPRSAGCYARSGQIGEGRVAFGAGSDPDQRRRAVLQRGSDPRLSWEHPGQLPAERPRRVSGKLRFRRRRKLGWHVGAAEPVVRTPVRLPGRPASAEPWNRRGHANPYPAQPIGDRLRDRRGRHFRSASAQGDDPDAEAGRRCGPTRRDR
jgi:hypothetical protein